MVVWRVKNRQPPVPIVLDGVRGLREIVAEDLELFVVIDNHFDEHGIDVEPMCFDKVGLVPIDGHVAVGIVVRDIGREDVAPCTSKASR